VSSRSIGVDLTLEAGDVHMLLARNGAGKSTLMKILSGAYRKDAGEIRFNGPAGDIGRSARRPGARHPRHLPGAEPRSSSSRSRRTSSSVRRPRDWGGVVDWRTLYETHRGCLPTSDDARRFGPPVSRLGLTAADGRIAKSPGGRRRVDPRHGRPTSSLTDREVAQFSR